MRTTQTVELDLARPQTATRGTIDVIGGILAFVWRVLRNRWAVNRLHDLDDRQLDDIGLSRHDLMKATYQSGIFDDPAALLSESARRRARARFERLSRL
ncbi:MAG TPA: DUF1127 domain-containing protein [Pseudorhizobium sp.]|nr:DUF1127 domain-containing protein [Pseudorhizobium sp.]